SAVFVRRSGAAAATLHIRRTLAAIMNKLYIKYLFQGLLPIFLFFSCNSSKKLEKKFYLTEINEQGFLLSVEDSMQIEKDKIENKKISDSCEINNLNCFLDGGYQEGTFN